MKHTAMSVKWFTLAFICVISAGPDDSQGRTIDFDHVKSPKFQGGYTTDWDNYPFIVALIDKNGNIFSGGVIISDEYVLTSQDVVITENTSATRVVTRDAVIYEVSEVFVETVSRNQYGHLAVLRVSTKFDLSGPNISSIELPNKSVPLDKRCVVVGVGGQNDKTPPEDVLHYKNLTTVDMKECIEFYSSILSEDSMCGKFDLKEISETCMANAGDPLLCDGELIGIASLANLCELHASPSLGVFSDIMRHKDWIQEQMNGGSTSSSGTETTQAATTTTTSTTTVTETTTPGLASINSCSFVLMCVTLLFTIFRI